MTLNGQQFVKVQGKDRPWSEMTGGQFFHGSPEVFEPGALIEPGKTRNFDQSDPERVSVTNDLRSARHWAREAAKGRGEGVQSYVYEVEPDGDVEPWRVAPANYGKNFDLLEGRTSRARVLRRVEDEDR